MRLADGRPAEEWRFPQPGKYEILQRLYAIEHGRSMARAVIFDTMDFASAEEATSDQVDALGYVVDWISRSAT